MFILFTVCVLLASLTSSNAEVLCEVGFCRNYIFDTGCASTSDYCRISNATHSGLSLPSPTTCNCCEYCLPYYPEGHHCSLGGAGDGATIGRCGHGLYCMQEEDGNHCRRMTSDQSECHAKQDDYDSRYERGETGALERRPDCNGKGKYAAYECVPTQTCFCQSEDGRRLFGEVPYRGNSLTSAPNMHCECSRLHDKISRNLNTGVRFPTTGPRCTADGNFHPIQCIDRTCFCVDVVTGLARNIKPIDLDVKNVTNLPCYNPTIDLYPEQSAGNASFNYTTPCYESVKAKQLLILQSEEEGYNVDYFSTVHECLPDGSYGRVLETGNGTKICVNETGQRIGNYEATVNTPEYESMDCKCAHTSTLLQTSLELPTCCANGNFRPVQCRRGRCRCVDEDGRQTSIEQENVANLPCFNENWQTC